MVSAVSMVCARNCAVAREFFIVQSSFSFSGMPASASTVRAYAAEAVDERPVAEIEDVRELRDLRSRPVKIAVVEEELQATKNLLRRAAGKADDQCRREKAIAGDCMQDREVTCRQLKRRRLLDAAEARAAKWR